MSYYYNTGSNKAFYKYYRVRIDSHQPNSNLSFYEVKLLTDELVQEKPFYQNEELAKNNHWREFGNGDQNGATATGFDTLTRSSFRNAAFTLDDGATSLIGNNIAEGESSVIGYTTGSFLVKTYIGTGLSIYDLHNQTTRNLCSDLPFGTYSIRHDSGAILSIDNVSIMSGGVSFNEYTFNIHTAITI